MNKSVFLTENDRSEFQGISFYLVCLCVCTYVHVCNSMTCPPLLLT